MQGSSSFTGRRAGHDASSSRSAGGCVIDAILALFASISIAPTDGRSRRKADAAEAPRSVPISAVPCGSNAKKQGLCQHVRLRPQKLTKYIRRERLRAAAPDAAVQMVDTSMVRVHQHAACIADSASQSVGRSRGGITSRRFSACSKPYT
jgi:hypothetical protein